MVCLQWVMHTTIIYLQFILFKILTAIIAVQEYCERPYMDIQNVFFVPIIDFSQHGMFEHVGAYYVKRIYSQSQITYT